LHSSALIIHSEDGTCRTLVDFLFPSCPLASFWFACPGFKRRRSQGGLVPFSDFDRHIFAWVFLGLFLPLFQFKFCLALTAVPLPDVGSWVFFSGSRCINGGFPPLSPLRLRLVGNGSILRRRTPPPWFRCPPRRRDLRP